MEVEVKLPHLVCARCGGKEKAVDIIPAVGGDKLLFARIKREADLAEVGALEVVAAVPDERNGGNGAFLPPGELLEAVGAGADGL